MGGEAVDPVAAKRQAIERFGRHLNPGKARALAANGLDVLEWHREGAVVEDADGRAYIDCITGFGVFNVGRRHPRAIAALKGALDDGVDIGDFMLMSKPKADLGAKLAQVSPPGLSASMLSTGGGEAVDFALKLARATTGRPGVLSTDKGYHGHSGFALSAAGRLAFRAPFEPLLADFTQVPFGDIDAMADAVDETIGAIIVEPIQGEGGINVAPDDYLAGLRALCDGENLLLIFDEIQSGMGRTGKLWASEHWRVEPDIMTVGKSLSGGVYPITATVYRSDYLALLDKRPFVHLSTFGGADVGCVVALEVFAILEDEGLLENATTRGEQMAAGFERLAGIYPQLLKETRGKGLMRGVEYHEPIGPQMSRQLASRGVLVLMSGNDPAIQRVMPVLGISQEQVDTVLGAFEDSLAAILEEKG
ncbi:MAG: aminotransferase class III-fold pyridoxal phosphate-dependent enzyme [Candidatus Dormiibacterota bacterium]